VISVNLQSLGAGCNETAQPRLAESIHIVDRAIQQVRNLSLDLRPSMLDELGLVSTLRWCADRQAQRAGFALHFAAQCSGKRLPAPIETACYRVAQEALTNVMRHAHAAHASVEFREDEDDSRIVLEIRDDGIGFKVADIRRRVARGASFGVQGMQERVELLGGKFSIESTPGSGTSITASLPSVFCDKEDGAAKGLAYETHPSAIGGRP
jgi:signal transduction histidine kinase